MSKKTKIIISVVLIIIALCIIKTYISGMLLYKFFLLSKQDENILAEIEKNIKPEWNPLLDFGTIPQHLENYTLSDDDIKKLNESDGPFTMINDHVSLKDLYNSEWQKNLSDKIDSSLKNNNSINLETFKKYLIPSTKELMKRTKEVPQPSLEDSSSWPMTPKFADIRYTAKYWYFLSRVFEKNNDFDSALLLSHSIFYMMKDFETNYKNSRSLTFKYINVSIRSLACQSILIWANKPKPKSRELSKEIAKDILDFVRNDYPISNSIEYEKCLTENVLDSLFITFGYGMTNLKYSKNYKDKINHLFVEPIAYIDKPIPEIRDKLNLLKQEREKNESLFESPNLLTYLYMFFSTKNYLMNTLFSLSMNRLDIAKIEYETNRAKMELTAIALAINSYYCETKKLPASMDELSNWFGEELPINRLTGKAYELNHTGNHIIHNKGLEENSESDDFFFDFDN